MTKTIANPGWIESILSELAFVEWDRFIVDDWDGEQAVSVYGWIDREDEYKDFVLVIFWPASETVYYVTSSDEYTNQISTVLLGGDDDDEHNDCRRVEHTFDIDNAVALTEQTTLTTDGTDRVECANCVYERPTFEACPECGEFGQGEQYHDDRTTLGYAYDGTELVAKLYKKKAVRECQASSFLTVSLTPAGEERSLQPRGEVDD